MILSKKAKIALSLITFSSALYFIPIKEARSHQVCKIEEVYTAKDFFITKATVLKWWETLECAVKNKDLVALQRIDEQEPTRDELEWVTVFNDGDVISDDRLFDVSNYIDGYIKRGKLKGALKQLQERLEWMLEDY